ncbi:MAG: amidohydrolase family protein [bacterium]
MNETKMTFESVNALSELEYFKLNESGKIELASKELGPIIDMHTHLGFTTAIAPPLNLSRRTPYVKHSFSEKGMGVDLSVYSGVNLTQENRGGLFRDYAEAAFFGSGAATTYTAPNLLEEMDRCGVERSVLLAMDLPGSMTASEGHIRAAGDGRRLIPFCGVSPRSLRWERHVEKCLAMGAKGLKYHPYINVMAPDHPMAIRLFRRWSRSGLPILFHTAHNGVEPSVLRQFSHIELYQKTLRRLSDSVFVLGHAGMGFFREAVAMAKEHGNTYLEIGGQPPDVVRELIDTIGPDRIMYGSDWPVYPLAMPLSKIFIATEGDPESRRKILYENAQRLLNLKVASKTA